MLTSQTFNAAPATTGGRNRRMLEDEMKKVFSHGKANISTTSPLDYDEDEEFYVIGDRVLIDNYRPGSVAYFGETEFGTGDWVGVVLDEPTGQHDGKLYGREYFQCAPSHGIFVRTHRVTQTTGRYRGGGGPYSRTPTPTYNQLLSGGGGNRWTTATPMTPIPPSRSSSKSPANSLLDSYYYDDDYRQDRGPTIASLARKLKSIDEHVDQHQSIRPSTPAGILKNRNNNNNNSSSRWPATGVTSRGSANSSRNSHSSGLGSSQHDLSSSSRMDDLDRRLRRASSMSPAATRRGSMFSFRPRREPLHDEPRGSAYQNVTDATARGVNFASEQAKLGDRVRVRTEREGELEGVLRFMGETEFATGEWAGVELDERTGKNDGSILGQRYFYCAHGHGLFVPASRVRKCTTTTTTTTTTTAAATRGAPNSFDSMRSTILSPPPPSLSPVPPRRHYESLSATPSSCLSRQSSTSPYSYSSTDRPEMDDSKSPPVRTYVSRATSISPPDRRKSPADILERHYNRRAKFDDRDLERELRRSSPSSEHKLGHQLKTIGPRAKAVTYTFITNKQLDGQPIAKRTLVYE